MQGLRCEKPLECSMSSKLWGLSTEFVWKDLQFKPVPLTIPHQDKMFFYVHFFRPPPVSLSRTEDAAQVGIQIANDLKTEWVA